MQQHDVDDTTTRKSDQDKAWPPNTPGSREAEDDIRSRPLHRKTILKDWENKCIVATKQHRGVHKDMLHQPQNTNSLRDTRDNTAHMVFEGKPAVKLHAKNINVETSANGNSRQDQVTMGRVHIPESTTECIKQLPLSAWCPGFVYMKSVS